MRAEKTHDYPEGTPKVATAQPCVTAPTGERRCTNEAVGPSGPLSFNGRTRPAEPSTFHRAWAEGVKWVDFVVGSSGVPSTQSTPRGKSEVPEHVNQYVSGTRLPATAWPRQTRPSTGRDGEL